MVARSRVLSDMRPTGRLHLGTFLGALDNWVRMQDEDDDSFSTPSCRRSSGSARVGWRSRATPGVFREILQEGSARARRTARETLAAVKSAIGIA